MCGCQWAEASRAGTYSTASGETSCRFDHAEHGHPGGAEGHPLTVTGAAVQGGPCAPEGQARSWQQHNRIHSRISKRTARRSQVFELGVLEVLSPCMFTQRRRRRQEVSLSLPRTSRTSRGQRPQLPCDHAAGNRGAAGDAAEVRADVEGAGNTSDGEQRECGRCVPSVCSTCDAESDVG